jgi:chromosome partitioning protein
MSSAKENTKEAIRHVNKPATNATRDAKGTAIPAEEMRELFHTRSSKKDKDAPKNYGPARVREIAEKAKFKYPKKNVIFHCLKGGASKTTLAYNCAYRLSQLGTKVLLVDLDKQANATHSFDIKKPNVVFVDVVTGKNAIQDAVKGVGEFLDLLPSSLENARLEMELIHRKKNPATYYKNIFAPIRDHYDIVIMDLPPDLSHNTYLSSLFADIICIPTNPDEYSVHGMKLTLSSIEGIRQEFNKEQQEVWVVWSKFDPRERSSLHFISEVTNLKPAKILPTVIRTDVTFKNAQERAKSVFQMSKSSNARQDIDAVAQELIGFRDYFGPRGEA